MNAVILTLLGILAVFDVMPPDSFRYW